MELRTRITVQIEITGEENDETLARYKRLEKSCENYLRSCLEGLDKDICEKFSSESHNEGE